VEVTMMPKWVTVAKAEDLPEGQMIGSTVDGLELLVANVGGHYVRSARFAHTRAVR
jgi:nitrite reductase/ring-hydroxylating ferredoxin subunit